MKQKVTVCCLLEEPIKIFPYLLLNEEIQTITENRYHKGVFSWIVLPVILTRFCSFFEQPDVVGFSIVFCTSSWCSLDDCEELNGYARVVCAVYVDGDLEAVPAVRGAKVVDVPFPWK